MIARSGKTLKKNVEQFDEDVLSRGSYAYTDERLSSRLANDRISRAIRASYDFRDKTILDIGCGDGTYTLDFPSFGAKRVLGIDPAAAAVKVANEGAKAASLDEVVQFRAGDLYALPADVVKGNFDCVVLRGVLHHLPDAPGALRALREVAPRVVVLEPNGLNPVLKILEKVSPYHISHEERSFTPNQLRTWIEDAGFLVEADIDTFLNLVPMFCPDWMANLLKWMEPFVERLPWIRNFTCGQTLLIGERQT